MSCLPFPDIELPKLKSASELVYGIVIRPPVYVVQDNQFISSTFSGIDPSSFTDMANRVQLITKNNFVGIVASSYSEAQAAAMQIKLNWLPPSTPAEKPAQKPPAHHYDFQRQYHWPNRMGWGRKVHWVTAEVFGQEAQVAVDSSTPAQLKNELAELSGLLPEQIELISENGSLTLARDCSDDAAADALLLAQLTGKSVAVLLTPDYQQDALALGNTCKIDIGGNIENDTISAFQYQRQNTYETVPVLALLLSKSCSLKVPAANSPTNIPYQFNHTFLSGYSDTASDNPESFTSSSQTSFARESWMDEAAGHLNQDPVQLRLHHTADHRGRSLMQSVAEQSGWKTDEKHFGLTPSPHLDVAKGRGFAYAHQHQPDNKTDSDNGTRSAWVVDISLNRLSGEVTLDRLVIGQDAGVLPDEELLKQNLQQSLFSSDPMSSIADDSYSLWSADPSDNNQVSLDKTAIKVVSGSDQSEISVSSHAIQTAGSEFYRPASGLMEPAVAAVSNAIYNATGIRFRKPPFTAELIRAELNHSVPDTITGKNDSIQSLKKWTGAALLSAAGLAAIAWPFKSSIPPITRPAATIYSAETIERGRLVAEAGDCAVCHSWGEGAENSGGRPFETPFGTLYSTNITPDEMSGIGNWSFTAFERAMRHGVSRDGRQLYPAFPYTSFAKISDADMQALYAFLMAQPAVTSTPPENRLSFPFNQRPLMAGWNALFHDPAPYKPDLNQSALWNRGAYLVEGMGHCSACHTPRNPFGAEKLTANYFGGAMIDGWEAPPLNELSNSPVPWTEQSLFDYLRTGSSRQHGIAAGPMAPVVAGLAQLPEQDVRAIAHYIGSFLSPTGTDESTAARQAAATKSAVVQFQPELEEGQRIFNGSCSACHTDSEIIFWTQAGTDLALNTNLHSDQPDNVIQTILYGVQQKSLDLPGQGVMPGFRDSLNDQQVTSLVSYLRSRFAPDKKPWTNISEAVSRYRVHQGTH